jgi:hypothetical protein
MQAWLHHSVLVNVGAGVKDPDCGGNLYEYFFESGNEKTTVPYGFKNSTFKSGYRLRPSDTVVINTELMNLDDKEKWVWLALTYDYLEGSHPDYKSGKIIWMSIGPNRCGRRDPNPFGASNLTATLQPTSQKLSESSFPWIAPQNGYILGFNGHMHDGGVEIKVHKNGKQLCTTVPVYSSGGTGMGGHSSGHSKRQMGPPPLKGGEYGNSDIAHISGQEPCMFDPPLKLTKGDSLHIESVFDFDKHPG